MAAGTTITRFLPILARQFPRGGYSYCPNGSHLALHDDQPTCMADLIGFLKDSDAGKQA